MRARVKRDDFFQGTVDWLLSVRHCCPYRECLALLLKREQANFAQSDLTKCHRDETRQRWMWERLRVFLMLLHVNQHIANQDAQVVTYELLQPRKTGRAHRCRHFARIRFLLFFQAIERPGGANEFDSRSFIGILGASGWDRRRSGRRESWGRVALSG